MADRLLKYGGKSVVKTEIAKAFKKGDPYHAMSDYDFDKERHTGKSRKILKDFKYYHNELGLSKHDAQIIANVKRRARVLDSLIGGKVGVSSLIGLILPVGGDVIDGLLSLSIINTSRKVSGGLDHGYSRKMVQNLVIEIVVGLTPVLGAIADGAFKANRRNSVLLEEMLVKRLQQTAKDIEKLEVVAAHGHAPTHGRHDSDHVSDLPPRYESVRHGRNKPLPAGGSYDDGRTNQTANMGGKWFSGRKGRAQDIGGRQQVAPVKPPRPGNALF